MTWNELKEYWLHEILDGDTKEFSWWRLLRRVRRSNSSHYLFWFRLADYLARRSSRSIKSLAKGINSHLIRRHGIEIMLGARIGKGLRLAHMQGIVIFKNVVIGKNFTIRQNTTVGTDFKSQEIITVGDDVDVGANSCIIGSGIRIGNRVQIGAMSFVNKSIPDDCTYITKKESAIHSRQF